MDLLVSQDHQDLMDHPDLLAILDHLVPVVQRVHREVFMR
jgi:hypothetical protein